MRFLLESTAAHRVWAFQQALIKDADSCGAMVQSAISGGSKAVQIYAAANGVPVPNEVMALGASMFQSYGIVSCEVVYGRAPNLSGYTQTADGAVVTPEALPRVTGQIVAGPSSTASGTGNSTEAQLGLLREQQKIEQEKRERQAKEDQDRRAQEERDRRAREESERRMQEIKQRSDMNATLINAGANVLGALISRLGRGTPTQPAETPAPTQSVASQQISKETLDNPLERLHGCGKTQSWQAAAVSRDRFSRGSLTPNLPVTRHSLVTFNSLAIPKHMSRLLLLFKLP